MRSTRTLQTCALCLALLLTVPYATAQDMKMTAPQDAVKKLPTIKVKAGVFVVTAEVAKTPAERSQGLMYRKSLGDDEGMLFVFESSGGYCFWMRNTFIPLSIAWLDEKGQIVTIAEMKPHSEESHCPSRPARFALEMNAGWFAKKGLKVGATLKAPGYF